MANNVNDLTPRWDNFAVYLPSIQKAYAKAAYKTGDKTRVMPDGITMKDLNFLNPNNKLFHYGYSLYSAGQFKVGEQQADIITNRTSGSIIVGDSGGFQIGKGTLAGFDALKNIRKPEDVCAAWTDAVELKTWIVNWLETHSDYAMTLDMPLWAQMPSNKSSPFHKCSTEQLINLTVENLRFIDTHRRGNTKWLNVIQGTTAEDMKLWWDAVKDFRFGGWALAGDTGWRGGAAAVIKQVLMMRDEGAFEPGLDWMHILGVSQAKWAVLLTAIQRGIRAHCNPNFRVSYDSASPNILSGRFQQVALYPNFTNKAESWSIRAARCPNDKVYVAGNPSYAFPFPSPIGDRLKMHHLNVQYDKYSTVNFDDVSQHMLTHHNTWVYIRAMLEANELAFLDRHDAENFVPPQLLECIYVFEELLTGGAWQKKWKKHEKLFDALKDLKSSGEFVADSNPVI
jgi:hypothetical protein